PAAKRRLLAVEAETAARTEVADLRLPVVQVVPHQVEAESQFMRALGPGDVVAMGDALFHARQRHPVRNAEAGVAGNADVDEAALQGIRTVGVRNAELLSEVGSEIVGQQVLALTFVAEDAIEQKVRTDHARVADGGHLDQSVALAGIGAGKSGTAGDSEY